MTYYEANRDRLLKKRAAYYRANATKVKAYNRARYRANKPVILAQMKAWREANPEKCYALTIMKRYGISFAEYTRLKRRKTCQICGKKFVAPKDKHLDHDHKSGKIRGVLCGSCNMGIGCLKDDPKLLRKAVSYLEAP